MGKIISLQLPLPPTENGCYRPLKGGHGMYKTKEAKIFQRKVKSIITANKVALASKADIRIMFVVHFPDNRRRDVANVEKMLFDALQCTRFKKTLIEDGVFVDDSQIVDHRGVRGYNSKEGYVEMEIEII